MRLFPGPSLPATLRALKGSRSGAPKLPSAYNSGKRPRSTLSLTSYFLRRRLTCPKAIQNTAKMNCYASSMPMVNNFSVPLVPRRSEARGRTHQDWVAAKRRDERNTFKKVQVPVQNLNPNGMGLATPYSHMEKGRQPRENTVTVEASIFPFFQFLEVCVIKRFDMT